MLREENQKWIPCQKKKKQRNSRQSTSKFVHIPLHWIVFVVFVVDDDGGEFNGTFFVDIVAYWDKQKQIMMNFFSSSWIAKLVNGVKLLQIIEMRFCKWTNHRYVKFPLDEYLRNRIYMRACICVYAYVCVYASLYVCICTCVCLLAFFLFFFCCNVMTSHNKHRTEVWRCLINGWQVKNNFH